MRLAILNLTFISLGTALSDISTTNSLQKRESGEFSCYNALNIIDFSALCPNLWYPIRNNKGLSTMGVLYFALATTTVPDDTVYSAQENIICTVNDDTGNITTTLSAGVGNSVVGAGASVTFTLSEPNLDGNSICMFTEGTDSDYRNVTDTITLKQARDLLYTMLTMPATDCKTCARIPIRYPNVTDGSDNGGILKIDVTDANNCLGKCVGPNSFSTASGSASKQMEPFGPAFGMGAFTLLATFWFVVGGMALFGLRLAPPVDG